jgi:uncharacterized repeat protein (TIGR03843 family)
VTGAAPETGASLELLSSGDLEVLGLLPYSSNYVFLARLCKDGREALAVYKPRRGERPLWDFPRGTLAAREVAAYLVSEAAGWRIVPPTILRADAPMGAGSMQLFVEHDPERHYFTLVEERLNEFAVFATFDVVVNNADRKAGHVLEDAEGYLWAVDHGVSFHTEEKLRTVIWHLAEDPLDDASVNGLLRLEAALKEDGSLARQLEKLLSQRESAATLRRVERLLRNRRLPSPSSDYHLPWPLI